MDKLNVTLVRSTIKSRPYAKTDGKYLGSTWQNNIKNQEINSDPESMFKLMQALEKASDTCIVSGTAVRDKISHTDRTLKNFKEEQIGYFVIDLDEYEVEGLRNKSYQQVVGEANKFLAENMPPEFRDTTYILCFSSSFLMEESDFLKCHMIFLLEEPQYPRELSEWIKHNNIKIDNSFYRNLTQPIFTAAPIWESMVDPLSLKGERFDRVSLIRGLRSHVPSTFKPYYNVQRAGKETNTTPAIKLPGKVGAFCRRVSPERVLASIGYSHSEGNRYVAPHSKTGIAGTVIFKSGYIYSHHADDPVNEVCEKVFGGKRKCLNAHDLAYGWSKINEGKDSSFRDEYLFMLEKSVTADQEYQDEVTDELVTRCEWLDERGYKGDNRVIIDGLLKDMNERKLTNLSKNIVFNAIKVNSKGVNLSALKALDKSLKRAGKEDRFDPEASIRMMADIFIRQDIIYPHQQTLSGDFWCYFEKTKLWRKCNSTQTKAFIYDHLHASLPINVEIPYVTAQHVISLVMRKACLVSAPFPKGKGWAFKGGKTGIIMRDLFSRKTNWRIKNNVRTLLKNDYIFKELPITYKQWVNSQNVMPDKYLDFLESSCQEDLEMVELVREFGGYVLGDSYFIHKMLVIEGVPGSGKSILGKIMQALVGRAYNSAVSINGITDKFGLGTLSGKQLALMSEARSVTFDTANNLTQILLKVIGNEDIDTVKKGVDGITERLDCKMLLLTNSMPKLPDDSGALLQRMLLLHFTKQFRNTDEEVLGLDEKIIRSDLPAMIRWHLKGLERLSKRKVFIEPASSMSIRRKTEVQFKPLQRFVQDYFEVIPQQSYSKKGSKYFMDTFLSSKEFTMYFFAYCIQLGVSYDLNSIRKKCTITKIRSFYPDVRKKMVRSGSNVSMRILGLEAKTDLAMEFIDEIEGMEERY